MQNYNTNKEIRPRTDTRDEKSKLHAMDLPNLPHPHFQNKNTPYECNMW